MLQHDYLLEIIAQFVEAVTSALRRALGAGDLSAAGEVEEAIAGLLDIDPSIAMQLSPDSLVTMMVLSGVGDAVAEYVGYALDKVGDAYAIAGRRELAEVRHAQAHAVYGSFGLEGHSVPPELEGLDKQAVGREAADGRDAFLKAVCPNLFCRSKILSAPACLVR